MMRYFGIASVRLVSVYNDDREAFMQSDRNRLPRTLMSAFHANARSARSGREVVLSGPLIEHPQGEIRSVSSGAIFYSLRARQLAVAFRDGDELITH